MKKIKPNRRAEIALRREPFEPVVKILTNVRTDRFRNQTTNRAMRRRMTFDHGGPKV